jgi:hypothetical protein
MRESLRATLRSVAKQFEHPVIIFSLFSPAPEDDDRVGGRKGQGGGQSALALVKADIIGVDVESIIFHICFEES